MKNLLLDDLDQPIEEVRRYMLARFDARKTIHPRLLEETVASVYRDLGWKVLLTSYSNDGGVDVVLHGSGDTLTGIRVRGRVGVQVKRSKKPIEAEQIRALTGALVQGRYTRGIFVTTERFRSGALKAAERSKQVGYPIHLIDAPKLYDALELTSRARYRSFRDWQASNSPSELHSIRGDEVMYSP
ncbi:MAG: restriction endonuclease [bacterium]|nr:restriction endonuclease [bacterium]